MLSGLVSVNIMHLLIETRTFIWPSTAFTKCCVCVVVHNSQLLKASDEYDHIKHNKKAKTDEKWTEC